MQTWTEWQCEVVIALRENLDQFTHIISMDDVDWAAFQPFFLEGRSPRSAVDRALERDL